MKCGKERPEGDAAAGAAPSAVATAPAPAAVPAQAPAAPAAPPMPATVPPPAAPPPAAPRPGQPPFPAAPPGYAPHPQPSRAGLFLSRTFAGDWVGALKVTAWPTALLLFLATVIAAPSADAYEAAEFGNFSDRFQAVLALLLQGLGATLEVETRSGGLLSMFIRGSGSVSVWPLTITLLWAFMVALGAKRLRDARPAGAGGGAEAAVRVALLCGVVVLVLGLIGQPDVPVVAVSTNPALAALFSCALAGAVSGAVLCRDALAARLGPDARMAVRAWGTALRALGLTTGLCAIVAFIVVASHQEDAGDWGWLIILPLLVNAGVATLGLSWGAGIEASSNEGSRQEGGTLGLSELGEAAGGWAQAGAVLLGVVCAVLLAVLVARRSADRREQVLSGVFFLAALWLLSLVSGASMEMTAGTSLSYRSRGVEASVATNAGELLLFGLLWTAGAVLLATLVIRTPGGGGFGGFGGFGGPGGPGGGGGGTKGFTPAPPMPGFAPEGSTTATPVVPPQAPAPASAPAAPATPPAPAAPSTPTAPPAQAPAQQPPAAQPPTTQWTPPGPPSASFTSSAPSALSVPSGPSAPRPRMVRRPLVWVAAGLAAFLVGGVVTGGLMLVRKGDDKHDSARKNDKSVVVTPSGGASGTPSPAAPSTGPTTGPSPSDAPSPLASGSASVPSGYSMVDDPMGFKLAIPEGWQRKEQGSFQTDYEASTGGSYVRVGLVLKSKQSSYDHFLELEKTLQEKNSTYKRVSLESNTFQGLPGARWEFTWTERNTGRTMHAIDQAYANDAGTEYAIYFQARDEYWSGSRKVFDTAVSTWTVMPVDFN
ncbi:hypothetical protein [Streptomyces triculaminicus]|uniref:hypothetical protein n=2 Tax=Streptomyces TaxID=1883 RepID=UPI0037B27CA3